MYGDLQAEYHPTRECLNDPASEMPASGWSEIKNMAKLKYGIAAIISALAILFMQATYAGTCSIPPVHISGVITLHITKYGMNYPLVRDDYKFSTGITRLTCPDGVAINDLRITGSKSLSKSADIQGNEAWVLPSTGEQQPQFAIEPSMRTTSSPDFVYADNVYHAGTFSGYVDVAANIDLVTLADAFLHKDGSSMTFSVPDPVMYMSVQGDNFSTDYPLAYLDNLSVNYIETSCGIKSKQGSVINWPALYKSDIVNGTAESKPYSLALICGDESAPPLPIDISFSASNGVADAANGIVRTNLQNLGLKLSWANPALPPLVLGQVNHSTLAGVGDYSVLAQPVKIGSSAGTIQAGQFDTTVTMNIEFQ
ncbi:hypothetical protein CWS43_06895 [Rahnella sp. AA]|uniref:fimbrial protein n=1 Tax=Rahnella sp. AA TaxID=2057180 RepID=UPI000C349305|nr:fimbrial protein [Rahnella sp. AA]PKE31771.1 hypothetical protein CWS43_06895 [Rahnella sp. AA]